jgi:tetratricopeptide (TPR) repeat protein/tRNA A-37 threonylcarbamoyl transferase component Bud32
LEIGNWKLAVGCRLKADRQSRRGKLLADFIDRVQAAVGNTYNIEKELGGGGMSRVFLAEEIELHRKVVIKVLPPDMAAGVNQDRFRREIQLAASLQHPHVVPLLTAGSDDDLLYYVMPYIEGESLRAKLSREGELPLKEVIRIVQEVTDALSFAHRHGVVHRDIKPDNILLSDGHAVVTDFGVSKAVSESTGGASSLTSLGVALGTPAYMSPEQAAADPHVDHRADIYALGAMAYEMLTGQPPFTGATPQAVLASQVSEPPAPVDRHRTTIPVPLANVVMRCLEKRPADRWQAADEMLPLLETAVTPTGGMTPTGTAPYRGVDVDAGRYGHPVRVTALFALAAVGVLALVYGAVMQFGLPVWVLWGGVVLLAIGFPIMLVTGHHERRRAVASATGMAPSTHASVGIRRWFTWRMALIGGVLAFAGLGVAAAGYSVMRVMGIGPAGTLMASGALDAEDPIIIAEFENRTPDSTLGRTATELLRIGLTQSQVVTVLQPTQVEAVLKRMERNPATVVDPPLAREMAEREGIKAYIAGEIVSVGSGFAISASLTASSGEVLVARQATAGDADGIVSAMDDLSSGLRERIGESLKTIRRSGPLDKVTTGSLQALRLYTQALKAHNDGDSDRAVDLLEEAVLIDTAFAMAYRKIGVILGNTSQRRDRMIEATTLAYQYRNRLSDLERFHAVALYHIRVTGKREEAIATYRTLLDVYPQDFAAINNLGAMYSQLRDYDRALGLYRRALVLAPLVTLGHTNVIGTYENLGMFDSAEAAIDRFAEAFPGNPRILAQRADLAKRRQDWRSVEEYWVQLADAQRGNLAWQGSASWNFATLAGLQGRIEESNRHWRDANNIILQRGQPSGYIGNVGQQGFMDILVRRRPRDAVDRLERALAEYPLDSMAENDRPYLFLVSLYAFAEDLPRAEALLADFEATGQTQDSRESARWARFAQGTIHLAKGDAEDAIREFHAFDQDASCQNCVLPNLARAYDMKGEVDSAIAIYERYTDSYSRALFLDHTELALAYRRLGELHEERGDTEAALQRYGQFVDQWREADAELQPQVEEIKQRMANLTGEPG